MEGPGQDSSPVRAISRAGGLCHPLWRPNQRVPRGIILSIDCIAEPSIMPTMKKRALFAALCLLLASVVSAHGQNPSVGDPNAYGVPADLTAPDPVPARAATPAATPAPAPAPAADPAPVQADAPAQAAAPPAAINVYQNYDFTPGDTILFA